MPPTTGTYSLRDLQSLTDINVFDFGEQLLADALAAEFAAHNRAFQDKSALLMDTTTERIITYGDNTDSGLLQEADEFSRTPARKQEGAGGTWNLPLRLYQESLGRTRTYLRQTSVAALANQVQGVENKDIRTLDAGIMRALFNPINYSVRDYTVVGRDNLNVKRLLNGDGMTVPNGPEGDAFDSAHTHYLASNGWTNAGVDAVIDTVREHGNVGSLRVFINATNRGNLAALSKYEPYGAPLLNYGITDTRAAGTIDNSQPDNNREIGVWDGLYVVSTKPYVPAGYAFVIDTAAQKPLAMRIPVEPDLQGLRLVYEFDIAPLRATSWEHRFGVGVQNRDTAAVSYMGGSVYVAPSGSF